jgi:hypothetical protein
MVRTWRWTALRAGRRCRQTRPRALIFSLLPVDLRLRCREVSPAWRDALNNPWLWTELSFDNVADDVAEMSFERCAADVACSCGHAAAACRSVLSRAARVRRRAARCWPRQ